MTDVLVVLNVVVLIALILVMFRKSGLSDTSIRTEMHLNRKEIASQLKDVSDSLDRRIASVQEGQLKGLKNLTDVVENRLALLQKDNSDKLERMRETVDEKLQSTLERRLGESFKIVGDRLEQVHKGLGEMQSLATDVSDFKRVLTNVKTRGTWGEVQLDSLLSQVFIKDHYDKQVMLNRESRDVVDFAIRLPDKNSDKGFIYLPIDAKFPLEDYQRLIEASEKGAVNETELASKNLIARVKAEAKSIREKYIQPPLTTDFAILYVPTEGLYAEIVKSPGFLELLQREYRVTVAGPATISAMLNSYQLGFRTLAIAEQSSHVWQMLTQIKSEFSKFGDLLEKTKDKLDQASRTIDSATAKSRTIEKRLGKMEQLEAKAINRLKD